MVKHHQNKQHSTVPCEGIDIHKPDVLKKKLEVSTQTHDAIQAESTNHMFSIECCRPSTTDSCKNVKVTAFNLKICVCASHCMLAPGMCQGVKDSVKEGTTT